MNDTNIQLVTHLFTKMGEAKGHTPLSAGAATQALTDLEKHYNDQVLRTDPDDAEAVFTYRTVKRALQQLLAHFENTGSSITDEDRQIYYEFAYNKLQQAERFLSGEEE
jgi:hypothetical protein